MNCWRCWFNNGAAVLVDAETEQDARRIAENQAILDGYGGLTVKKVECLTNGETV